MTKTYLETSVDILIDGKPIKQFHHEGRTFVQANKGQEYEVRIKNNSNLRVLASFAIDGVCPLSGEKSGKDAGYVINGGDSFTLRGYRISDDKVNAFKFSDKKSSYAVKSKEIQDESNVGCIGVRIFAEKIEQSIKNSHDFWKEWYEKDMNRPHVPIPWNPPIYPNYPPYNPWYDDYGTPIRPWCRPYTIWYSSTSQSTPANNGTLNCNNSILRSCSLGENDLNNAMNATFGISQNAHDKYDAATPDFFDTGTEFSDKEIIDKVKEVSFEKGEILMEQEIFYMSREKLIALGVPIIKETKVNFPSAFPKKYCVKPE